jgi:predicted alpha/beta-fold hydrolase
MIIQPFSPPAGLQNGYVQTFLASAKFRVSRNSTLESFSHPRILTTDDDIRLLGYHACHTCPKKGLVILIHGWEGSSHSTYILSAGQHFFQNGFDVFRLNLRDHGSSHHLNAGLFYAVLLEEVFQAVRKIALESTVPVFLMGFSLGGNFVLRILKRCETEPIPPLRHAIAVSPVLDPSKATDRIDRNPFIRAYFLKKWRRSLMIKQKLFPDRYDFTFLLGMNRIRAMTEILLEKYSGYNSADDYFAGYAVMGDALKEVHTPLTIITSEDDPIIPVHDFRRLETGPAVHRMIQNHGGHNGFLAGFPLKGWHEAAAVQVFSRYQLPVES